MTPLWPCCTGFKRNMGQYEPKGASQVALVVKNLSANAGDLRDSGLILGLERSPGEGHGNPFQYSCLENLMDKGAWWGLKKLDTMNLLTMYVYLDI